MLPLHITPDDLRDARVIAFLASHLHDMRNASPPGSMHALDVEALRQPGVQFWSAWVPDASERDAGHTLVGTAALQRIAADHVEIKSMRTAAGHRGQGFASRLLEHVMREAQRAGVRRLSLETGSQPFFAPARALYLRHGFTECAAFEGYAPDPASCFMTRTL